MCGIVGYAGHRKATEVLINGLKTLEYRGYDSAGLYTPPNNGVKVVGQVKNLIELTDFENPATMGIAHTRWATHGAPTEQNAHPLSDCSKKLWLVHNGIIENYRQLKEKLIQLGHNFESETDTEVIIHLIEENLKHEADLETAFIKSLKELYGTYGIALIHQNQPEKILVARMGSPIALGIGDKENIIASDTSAILAHTKDVIYLNDGDLACIEPTTYRIFNFENRSVKPKIDRIEWDIDQISKNGQAHFMIKEILEIPETIQNSMRGRVMMDEGTAKLGGLEAVKDQLQNLEQLIIVACGSTYYAGQVGKYMLEEYANIPTNLEFGSEFRYRSHQFKSNTAVLAISQSGETADTLAAIQEAKRKGIMTLGIVNVVGSTIARETDAGVYNHAGPEIGVATTKVFISQLTILALLTLYLARQRQLSISKGQYITKEIMNLQDKAHQILDSRAQIEELAKKYSKYHNFLYLGRKYSLPIALEGALKLKEISYIHAEGCAAGEMKHGPIAMIDERFPTVAIATKDSVYEKTLSNITEIKSRNGKIIAVATQGDPEIKKIADDVIFIPECLEALSPILSVLPLQLLAYYIGVAKGYNVDKPRNLAKSVTVE